MLRSGLIFFLLSVLTVVLRTMEVDAFTGPHIRFLGVAFLCASIAFFMATYWITESVTEQKSRRS